ncbi:nicotinate-nucleotide adenylyltransferase [Candidatus Bipolaricaulota bacterium]|nr:nicotinate-nucleotide adenylyltransferase [Candidatus Bipolaricaulota bacterium]
MGLFGGTFNPLHNAHLKVARTALEQYELSGIIFVPNGIPPHKEKVLGCDTEDRYEMVRLAVESVPGFEVSRIEVDREGPSYTIDTIRALKDDYPQGICFIVGADRLLKIDTWKEPHELLRSVPFIIAPRWGVNLDLFDVSPFSEAVIVPLQMEDVDLSSSGLRERILRGESIRDWVPSAVAEYIEAHKLYRTWESGVSTPSS